MEREGTLLVFKSKVFHTLLYLTAERVASAVEMMAGFHRKLRDGAIRPVAYAALIDQVRAHIEAGALQWLAQDQEIFLRLRQLYQKLPASVFLRGQLLAAAKHFCGRKERDWPSALSSHLAHPEGLEGL